MTKVFSNLDLRNAAFEDVSLRETSFANIDLSAARFDNVNFTASRFDDIDFTDVEITGNCNFRGMRIDGVLVSDLFAAYRNRERSHRQ